MALVPAICDSCGTIWGAENIFGGDAKNLILTGNKVGPCPKCGGLGSIPDGVYDIQDDTFKVIDTGNIPADVLQGLIDVLDSLRRGEASSSEVIETVEREAPALAPTVKSVLDKSDPAKWVLLLIAIIALYLQATAASPPSAEEVADEIREKPVPTYSVPPPTAPKAKAKPKRPPKAHRKTKQRKSRKRR
jgi:hypothetical protein